MGNIKNLHPKKHCPNQYNAATRNPLLKSYAQLLTGGRGTVITATELRCQDTQRICSYASIEKECPKYQKLIERQ